LSSQLAYCCWESSQSRRTSGQGYVYDLSGNLITDSEGRSFAYNADNKQREVRDVANNIIGQYYYDGDGKRVKKFVPATGETTIFVYDASGKMLAEYSTIVEPQSTAKVSYLTTDHLGSPRILTEASGNVISRRDFHPFGEEIITAQRTQGSGYAADSVRQKFTGYERDIESALDFAQARHLNNGHGRFTSPDPMMGSALRVNPQTYNRYVYVLNNPLSLVDPRGLKPDFLVKRDREGHLMEVMRADDESEGFQGLLDAGWQRVEFDENGRFSYLALDENGNERNAVLRSDGTWGWAPTGTIGRVLTGIGVGAIAGAVAGTEELPVIRTIIVGVGDAIASGIIAATSGPDIIEQTSAPATPATRSTPFILPSPS
jgi:RHS repeat-associated protein